MASTQQFFVTGRVPISVGTGAGGALEFLGYSEGPFSIEPDAKFVDVFSDLTGSEVAADSMFMGEDCRFSVTLARYDELVLQKLSARLSGGTMGTVAATRLGTLMIAEGFAMRLLLDMTYQSKTAMANLPPAFNFLQTWPDGTISHPLGLTAKKPRISFRCLPVMDPTTGVSVLYNSITTGKPTYV